MPLTRTIICALKEICPRLHSLERFAHHDKNENPDQENVNLPRTIMDLYPGDLETLCLSARPFQALRTSTTFLTSKLLDFDRTQNLKSLDIYHQRSDPCPISRLSLHMFPALNHLELYGFPFLSPASIEWETIGPSLSNLTSLVLDIELLFHDNESVLHTTRLLAKYNPHLMDVTFCSAGRHRHIHPASLAPLAKLSLQHLRLLKMRLWDDQDQDGLYCVATLFPYLKTLEVYSVRIALSFLWDIVGKMPKLEHLALTVDVKHILD